MQSHLALTGKGVMNRINRTFIALVLTAFLLTINSQWWRSPSFAQDANPAFYVAPGGSDRNEGSLTRPWATVNHAAEVLKPGQAVYIRSGTYKLTQQVKVKNSGTEKAWVTYRAYPGERVILDANSIRVDPPAKQSPYPHDQGAFQLENVQYIQVRDLEIINSHNSGFTVRNSQHISLYNNRTRNTFSPGIGVWQSGYQKVIGNTVINANASEMADFPMNFSETPHEAISLGSVDNFEVSYNLVHDGQKEGIDIKETSKHGTVHHNYVHHMRRQALYIDSHFGGLTDVEMFNNVAHDCEGAGFAISVEGGTIAQNIRFHHNLLFDNWGTGILFSRWGNDGLRRDVRIYNNTVYHNGYGKPNPGEKFFWITGGLYLFSDNLKDVEIKRNIFSENTAFQIGYSDLYLSKDSKIENVLYQKNVEIDSNLVFGANSSNDPVYAGWKPDNYANIYGIDGTSALVSKPQFIDSKSGNFYLSNPLNGGKQSASNLHNSSTIGAFLYGEKPDLWWQSNFPPRFKDSPS